MIKDKIEKIIKKALKSEFSFNAENIEITNPDPKFGDFAISLHKYAKDLKINPQDIAIKLSKSIKDSLVEKTQAVSGYLNITLDMGIFSKEILSEIINKDKKFGASKSISSKVLLEYSSPNTNKPLHLGHIRNNVLGMSLSKILSFQGAKVITTQIINDRGIHIMKSLVAYRKLGDSKTPQSLGIKGDHFVGEYYIKFDENTMSKEAEEALRALESGDKKVLSLWKKMNSWAEKGHVETYKKLGSEFDKTYYESETYKLGKEIVEKGVKSGIFYKEKDSSVWIDLEDIGLDKKLLQRSDGTSVYVTQDLGLAEKRAKEFKFDSLLYVVGHEQEYHFKVLFEILSRLGFSWSKNLRHLSYGLVFLPEGKMKSREGKVVDADDIIEDVCSLAKEEIKKRFPDIKKSELESRSFAIGMGALKFMLLRITPSQSIHFNPKEAIAFEGSTGPYVQYAHARASSILEQAGKISLNKINFSVLVEPEEAQITVMLSQYNDILCQSAGNYNPSLICNYLLDLSRIFNAFYHKHSVLSAEDSELKIARIALVKSVQIVLRNGLNLLRIEAPEKM
jgi:arginyl-tRNA synthetase